MNYFQNFSIQFYKINYYFSLLIFIKRKKFSNLATIQTKVEYAINYIK